MTDSLQVFDKMRVSASLNPNHDPDGDSRSPRTGGLLGPTLGWFLRRIWCFPSNRSYLRNQLILLGWSLDVAHGTESIGAEAWAAGFSHCRVLSKFSRCLSQTLVTTDTS